jgi:translocation and assembly module TamA
MKFFKKIIFLIFLFPICLFSLNYDVKFIGLKDKTILNSIKSISSLITLKDQGIKSTNALKYRAKSDVSEIIKVLNFYGYYDAKIDIDIDDKKNDLIVFVFMATGSRYSIKDIKIYTDGKEKKPFDLCDITLDDLNLKINSYLVTDNILNAEKKLIDIILDCGYPFVKVDKRDVVIDTFNKNASVEWYLDTGPLSKFGKFSFSGIKDIDLNFIKNKILFKENRTYNQKRVYETQQSLLSTNLFSSVAINHSDRVDENDKLEMDFKFVEALHKYVTAGVSFATVDGFGFSFGWANRNFLSKGELLAIDLDVSQRLFLGEATYKKPQFIKKHQDYVLRFEASREKIPITYTAFVYSMENRLDKNFSKKVQGSIGFTLEYDEITRSANDNNFFLISAPMFIKYSSANNLLNPTHGQMIVYRAAPYKSAISPAKYFFKQNLVYSVYIPLESNRRFIFALRMQLGSIFGAKVFDLPLTKLFLGGSDDDLRGYKYKTVSPLNANGDPIGGRSCIYFSFEPRIRITDKIGLVPFSDFGVISEKEYPSVNEKWYKSLGMGFRYFSFFGPIRLDIAFPMDRRSNIDSRYKIYVNVGQSF